MVRDGFPKILLLLLVVVLIVIGLGTLGYLSQKPSTTATSNPYYNQFKGPAGRFSFEYPSEWKLTQNEKKGEYIFDQPQDFVTVFIGEQGHTITEGSIEKNFSEALEKQKANLTAQRNFSIHN